jgi:hypothetical protein
MAILSRPSSAAYTAVVYITVGALTDVWSSVWYLYLSRDAAAHSAATFYLCYAFMLSGLTLLVIGLAIGRIGRAARHAELPPEEVTAAAAQAEQIAAARPPVAQLLNPGAQPPAPVPPVPPAAPVKLPAGAADRRA